MTKELLNITEKNIKYLKTCLDLTESHITWGTKNVREKYSKIKERLQKKLQEEKVYRNMYMNPPNKQRPSQERIDKIRNLLKQDERYTHLFV
jgi:hypothetical protein|tara:strand:- start:288 stop:563 length:276 start_codon:yes stop_codon:yes gene_type:complete